MVIANRFIFALQSDLKKIHYWLVQILSVLVTRTPVVLFSGSTGECSAPELSNTRMKREAEPQYNGTDTIKTMLNRTVPVPGGILN